MTVIVGHISLTSYFEGVGATPGLRSCVKM